MNITPFLNPRLVFKNTRESKTGYLQLNPYSEPMVIGLVGSAEYKLIQSLFNPSNTKSGYRAVHQTYERTFANVTGAANVDTDSGVDGYIRAMLAAIIVEIGETQAGKHISFIQAPNYIFMEIHLARTSG